MQKAAFILMAIAISSFAENASKINFLIDNDLYGNFEQIQKLALEASDDQKFKLYETQKKKPLIPVLVNALTIPGIGSLINKDYIGASISFVGYTSGITMLIVQGSMWKPDKENGTYVNQKTGLWDTKAYSQDSTDYEFSKRILLPSGLTLLIGSWIFSIVRPVIYSNHYNIKLGQALNLSCIRIDPIGKEVALSFSF
jgi:hypothetical protein